MVDATCRHQRSQCKGHMPEAKLRDKAENKPEHHSQKQEQCLDQEYWTDTRSKGLLSTGCSTVGVRQRLFPEFMHLLITDRKGASQQTLPFFLLTFFPKHFSMSIHIGDTVVPLTIAQKKKKKKTCDSHAHVYAIVSIAHCVLRYVLTMYNIMVSTLYHARVTNFLQLYRH